MEDLSEYTKDYFKKNDQEKLEIFNMIYNDLKVVVSLNNLESIYLVDRLLQLENKSVLNEDYEVAELFRSIRRKILEESVQL
jgi:hypothetical protein